MREQRRPSKHNGAHAGGEPDGPRPGRVPKLNGCDTELGNLIQGLPSSRADTCYEASRLLLSRIEGLPRVSRRHATGCGCAACRAQDASWKGGGGDGAVVYDPQDFGRKFLPANGGCVYIDLDHLELALPEVLSARDHVAAWWAMLRVARAALHAVNASLPEGQRAFALANNSDGRGHSYGGHLSFMVTRRCFDNVMDRRPHYLGYLASYQASSIVVTGQGKVASENDREPVDFQLSQRADFFEALIGVQTTYRRPLVNSRDEALCGASAGGPWRSGRGSSRAGDAPARLHCIFYDTNLSQVASFLKVGVMQMVLALIEAERVDARLTLDDPLAAVLAFSHDPGLRATARLADGRRVTAVELQALYLEALWAFHARDGFAGIVPDAGVILDLWEETLGLLAARDLPALAGRLDWALKLSVLRQTLHEDPTLSWQSPTLKYLDHLYSSVDDGDGLFWAYHRAGLTREVVDEGRVAYLTANPPEDTRAFARALLLRRAGADRIDDVDWDRIRFRTGGSDRHGGADSPAVYRRLDLAAPLGLSQAGVGDLFERAATLEELLDLLGADAPTLSPAGWEPARGAC